jgi:hypothetical protein
VATDEWQATLGQNLILQNSGSRIRANATAVSGQGHSLHSFEMGVTGGNRFIYGEILITNPSANQISFGIAKDGINKNQYLGEIIDSIGWWNTDVIYRSGTAFLSTTGKPQFKNRGSVGKIFVDRQTGSLWMGVQHLGSDTGGWMGDPSTLASPVVTGLTGSWRFAGNPYGQAGVSNAGSIDAKFHRFSWIYDPPHVDACPVNAQTLSGTAKLHNDDPASTVYLHHQASGKVKSIVPSALGIWSMKTNEGDYLITAEGPAGYRPQSHFVVAP